MISLERPREPRHTSVKENTGRSGIQNTADDASLGAVTVVRLPHSQSNGDTDRGADRVKDGGDVSCVVPLAGEVQGGKSGTETESFEHFWAISKSRAETALHDVR